MKYIRFPQYRRFAVPLQGCNGFAVPDVISEGGQRASGDRLFYFIVQMKSYHPTDEAKTLSASMNALKALNQVITAMAELSALEEMPTADRKQLNETVHDFCTEAHGIIQGVISKYVER